MTENSKLVALGSEFEEKGYTQKGSFVNEYLQQQWIKSDGFAVDMERLEKEISTKPRIMELQRNLSRKGSPRGAEKKINQSHSNDTKASSMVATSPRGHAFYGGSVFGMPVAEALGTGNCAVNLPIHNPITVINGKTGNITIESKYGGQRFSFRRSSLSLCTFDPKKILIFFATLSSLGTIVLIYLALSMSKIKVEESALD